MLLTARRPITNTYRVEVSGWDSSRSFFVETSNLDWSEETGKHVALYHALRQGAIIFVRLLQPIAPDRSHPVAYQTEFVATTREGQRQFRLNQVRPRLEQEEPALR
jgi:hypothetical protein